MLGNYLYLDTISITATANYGYHFSHWNDSVIDNPRLIQIFGDTLFTAVFEKNTYTLLGNVDIDMDAKTYTVNEKINEFEAEQFSYIYKPFVQ